MSHVKKVDVLYVPVNDTQKAISHKWRNTKLGIFLGVAGTGKTTAALGQALSDLQNKKVHKIVLCRPTVAIDEDIGFLPGDTTEKLMPWLGAFSDVLGDISHNKLEDFQENIEIVPVGMLRGRTIKKAVLIVDEAQNLSYNQLKCIITRVGIGGKIILCGDISQSDLPYSPNPLSVISKKVSHVEGVSLFNFTKEDQMREPFIIDILHALN